MSETSASHRIDSERLHQWITSGERVLMIDLRESAQTSGTDCIAMKLHELPGSMCELPRDRKIVVACKGGKRSAAAACYLREEGFEAWTLHDGESAVTDHELTMAVTED